MLTAQFKQQLDESDNIHIPLPIDETETADFRLLGKPVLQSRLITDGQALEGWKPKTTYETITLGEQGVTFTHPTNLDTWVRNNPGRIYEEPGAIFVINREDWREWNRLSVWVYPVADGMKSITGRLQLYNDGRHKVPDKYLRDGHHNVSVKNREWNHIVLEIPYLDREAVTGVAIEYDMVGHEPEAVDQVSWYIKDLELQKVDADLYETWAPMPHRVSYSHSGYQTGSDKIAVLSDPQPKTFKLIEMQTGKIVLEKEIADTTTPIGRLRVLDFSEVMQPGRYMLVAGDITSRAFAIDDEVWETSIWKTLNFFLVLRCGYEVPGKHRACHADMRLVHNDQAIIANGGWHDAADLAQGMHNTAEATQALLSLALSLEGRNPRLFKRVREEAKWGLDYVLKTRFSDGYRSAYSSTSIWTDGVIGTKDDIVSTAAKSAWRSFDCAYAEALGAKLFAQDDPDYARYCVKIAREDFKYAEIFIDERKAGGTTIPPRRGKHEFPPGDYMDAQVASLGALAAAALFDATGDAFFEQRAVYYADLLIACQQQELTDWDVPMTGFFYQDLERNLIWHHNHMSYSCFPDMALRTLCEVFGTKHPLYMKWYHALVLSGEYYRLLAAYTQPYGVIPAGVYHEDEMENHQDKVLAGINQITEDDYPLYKEQVRQGFPVGKGHYIRVFPVWFSFRGNYKVLLNESKSMACAAHVRNDYGLYNAAQHNYQWIVGKNPFAQSTMYGEGYDYIQLYAVQPGQTVGALPVGMQSHRNKDIPYWPQVNTATYKEVWVCPPTKWVSCLADNHLPAVLEGYMKPGQAAISFVHKDTGRQAQADVSPHTGYFCTTLPAGHYTMTYDGTAKDITVINGKRYTFGGVFYGLKTQVKQDGAHVEIQVTLAADHPVSLVFAAHNLHGFDAKITQSTTIKATVTTPGVPWVGLVYSEADDMDRCEVFCSCLP